MSQLVYDVGMHKGEDTDYYLKRGCRVIAFEADPDLAAENRTRYSEAIREGRLKIIEGAVVEDPSASFVNFFLEAHENNDMGHALS